MNRFWSTVLLIVGIAVLWVAVAAVVSWWTGISFSDALILGLFL